MIVHPLRSPFSILPSQGMNPISYHIQQPPPHRGADPPKNTGLLTYPATFLFLVSLLVF